MKESRVISGPSNLKKHLRLNNMGHVKRIINNFMKVDVQHLSNEVNHDKREFIPFVDERD